MVVDHHGLINPQAPPISRVVTVVAPFPIVELLITEPRQLYKATAADEIIWQAFANGKPAVGIIAMIAALLTAFYMFRLLYMTFYGSWRGPRDQEDHVHESPKAMTIPLAVLGVLSVIGGWIMWPKALAGGAWFEHFLHPSFAIAEDLAPVTAHHSLAAEYVVIALSLAIAVGGILWARAWYIKNPEIPQRLAARFKFWHKVLLNKYYIDEGYDFMFVQTTIGMGESFWKVFDVKIIDGIVNGTAQLLGWLGSIIRRVQTGLIGNYALMMALGIVVIVGYMVWR